MNRRAMKLFHRTLWILTLAVWAESAASGSSFRDFSNTEGTRIRAKLVDFRGDEITIIRESDGRRFTIPLAMLSEADRDFAREWHAARLEKTPPRLEVTVKRGREDVPTADDSNDDRHINFRPGVDIENKEVARDLTGLRGTVVILGQSVLEANELKVMTKQNFTVSLSAREKASWKGNLVRFKYDDYPDNGHAYGHKYGGYIVLIESRQGSPYLIRGSRSTWRKMARFDALKRLEDGATYDRGLEERVPPATF